MLRMERLGRAREIRMSTANSICTYAAIPCQRLFQVFGAIDIPCRLYSFSCEDMTLLRCLLSSLGANSYIRYFHPSVHDARINLNFQSNSLPCGFQLSVSRITTILPTVRLHYPIISPPSNLSLLVLFTCPALLHLYQTNSSQNSTFDSEVLAKPLLSHSDHQPRRILPGEGHRLTLPSPQPITASGTGIRAGDAHHEPSRV